MTQTETLAAGWRRGSTGERKRRLESVLEHVAHLLPRQGPIGVFVHHNTLHAFEGLPFEDAVIDAWRLFGAEPYMSEAAYRAELARGRIRNEDIDSILDGEIDGVIFPGLSRRALRRAMITPGVREFDAATILWRSEQGDLAADFSQPKLRALFDACLARTGTQQEGSEPANPVNEIIHPWLIRLCSVFLDQGMAYWRMPFRERGFYWSVRALLSLRGGVFPRYLVGLEEEFRRQSELGFLAADAVLDYLDSERVPEIEWEQTLRSEILALPGWAGLIRRLEEDPNLAPHEKVPCALMDFLAVRLTMARVAAQMAGAEPTPEESPLKTREKRRLSRAARIYDAARVAGLSPAQITALPDLTWVAFTDEVRACNGLERRCILHLAYERRQEREVLCALGSHRRYAGLAGFNARPTAQVFFCIDEREESMRRALEELAPEVETFSAAGYFGIAVDYQGIDDPQGAAFCPVVVKPQHAVIEQPSAGDSALLETRRSRRRLFGRLMRHSFLSSRTLLRGWLSTTVLGLLSAVPLIGHLLAPRGYARLRAWMNRAFVPEPRTELTLMRNSASSQQTVAGLLVGFVSQEKTDAVASVLGPAGLRNFARLVLIVGHGSSSLNNPHESAHDCGACGGRRGGPNARLFAAMANRRDVRLGLRQRGIDIPDDTWFVGAYHDTCNDDVELYDLTLCPDTHLAEVERLRALLEQARARNAHERTRRFEHGSQELSPSAALRHVEERSEHLAQPRPEYGHCTNAVCIIGRRSLTRELFLDRRAFLVSYDPYEDAENASLASLLAAVIPVCAGISLEYYFSFVDNERYGCGTKLPHNVTGLVGIMDGHASDLRTGLPWQMVEIHEPMRMLFVVETTPERLMKTMKANPSLNRLLENRWIRMATVDPATGVTHALRNGQFEPFTEEIVPLPVARSSAEWYGGKIEHLPISWIHAGTGAAR